MALNFKNIFMAVSLPLAVTATSVQADAPSRDQVRAMLDIAQNVQCATHDGYQPLVTPMSSDGLYHTFSSRFGAAQYREETGYVTYLDVTELPNASEALQTFIIEHECGHHELGHTYKEYDFGFITPRQHHEFEREADCFALQRMFRHHGYGRDDESIIALMDELEEVNANIIWSLSIDEEIRASLLNDLPQRSEHRTQDALTCPFY